VAAGIQEEAQSPFVAGEPLCIDIEHVTTRAPWWFPYAERRR